ncbi:unnamed protein product [Calicophoron daubneyi]|uniref:Cystatin domain-containing protein n=1 Tax=Calicophoron daubneyi TaxID=300641 RepID=A0AAV2TKZ1_CALDB
MKVLVIWFILLLACVGCIGHTRLVGGYSDERDLTVPEIWEFGLLIMQKLPQLIGKRVSGFKFVSVRTQVVAGMNYLVLIRLPDHTFYDVKIFRPLPCDGGKIRILSAERTVFQSL